MAASLALSSVDGAPGNVITLAGTDLTGASLALQNQGLVTPGTLAIPATADSATSVTFTVPDGATSAPLVLTAGDGSQAAIFLNVVSQYLQSSEYPSIGEGTDTSAFVTGELDDILRDASAYVDELIGNTLRLLQVQEEHAFSESRKIWPYRSPRQKIPLVSLDALSFITSNAIMTTFTVTGATPDVYTNQSLGYFDVQAYAVGNAILLGAIQTIGFSANVWKAVYTAGYPYLQTPRAIKRATAMIATEMITYRQLQSIGMGALSKFDDQLTRRKEAFELPPMARELLRPYVSRSMR
jgi:hypothetical protein